MITSCQGHSLHHWSFAGKHWLPMNSCIKGQSSEPVGFFVLFGGVVFLFVSLFVCLFSFNNLLNKPLSCGWFKRVRTVMPHQFFGAVSYTHVCVFPTKWMILIQCETKRYNSDKTSTAQQKYQICRPWRGLNHFLRILSGKVLRDIANALSNVNKKPMCCSVNFSQYSSPEP